MPKLIVQLRQQTVQELDLTGDRVVIGRGEENAVKLDDNLASREHAEIREENGRYLLSDLGSANGTYVGGKRIASGYELKDGDVIKISPYTILFRLAAHEKPTQVGMVQTTEKPTEVFTFSGTPRLLVRSGAEVGKSYDLTNNPLLGRGEDSDIVLNEGSVSRKHARVQFLENKLTIVDVGSRSGTRVNGKLIDKPTQLKDGDKVQLGEAALEVDWKGAPRTEVEKATVPFFRPELAPANKGAEWWKWAVGIAACLIVVIGGYLIIKSRLVPPPGGSVSEVRDRFDRASRESDLAGLETALATVGSVIKRGASDDGRDLQQKIEVRIKEVKDAKGFVAQAEEAARKGDLEAAVRYVIMAFEKDPNSDEVRGKYMAMHRSRANVYELDGRKARERGESFKANDLFNRALGDWDAILALDAANVEAMNKKEEMKGLLGLSRSAVNPNPIPPRPTPPEPGTKYDKAKAAYRDGRLAEARGLVDEILKASPDDYKAKELKGWIELWEEATYLSDVRGDAQAAVAKLKQLLQQDPGNYRVQALIQKSSMWDSQKAKGLFQQAEQDYLRWKDYGEEEFKVKAIQGYQEIVKMGPPPGDAPADDLSIYNTAKQKSAE